MNPGLVDFWIYTRSVSHSSAVADGCGGAAYRFTWSDKGDDIGYQKEMYHNADLGNNCGDRVNLGTRVDSGSGNLIGKWFGIKCIMYNTNNNASVHLETWMDKDDKNAWVKVKEETDSVESILVHRQQHAQAVNPVAAQETSALPGAHRFCVLIGVTLPRCILEISVYVKSYRLSLHRKGPRKCSLHYRCAFFLCTRNAGSGPGGSGPAGGSWPIGVLSPWTSISLIDAVFFCEFVRTFILTYLPLTSVIS